MKAVIAEHPVVLALMLGVTAAAFFYAWLQSGKRPLAIAGAVFLVAVPISWYVSTGWVTDRERLRNLIYETAEAVGRNDHQAAVKWIGDPETKAKALAEMPRYEFDRVKVSMMEFDFVKGSSPPRVVVDVNAVALVSAKSGHFSNVRAPRRLYLTFEKGDDDRWMMVDYYHTPMNGQPDMFSPVKPRSR